MSEEFNPMPEAPVEKKDNKKVIIIVVAVLLLCCCCVAVGVGGYYAYMNL
ncbi:MAG: hypothetical protein ABIJ65_06590 [Chloroflexota bacterium]